MSRTVIYAIEPTTNAADSPTERDSRCKQVTETQERKAVFSSGEVWGQYPSGEPHKNAKILPQSAAILHRWLRW